MGCDMAWFVERQRDDGTWEECSSAEYAGRDYTLFTALADVRHEDGVQVISDPKGLPDDVGAPIRDEYEYTDERYGASWHTLETLMAYDWEGNDLAYFRRMLEKMAALGPPDKVRAVFWFSG